jgi:hypothetical protein
VAVEDGLTVAALGDAGIAVLEADAEGLQLSASLALSGTAHGVAVKRGTAFVAAGPNGLQVVDLTDPTRPAILGATFADHDVRGVATGENGIVLAAAASDGLLVADVSDPRAPRVLSELFTGGHALSVHVVGRTAYLADGWGGVRTIDVSDPSKPKSLGAVPTAGWAWHIAIDGGVAPTSQLGRRGWWWRIRSFVDPLDPRRDYRPAHHRLDPAIASPSRGSTNS